MGFPFERRRRIPTPNAGLGRTKSATRIPRIGGLRHYPTMSIEQLYALPIPSILHQDVVFWPIPNYHLREAALRPPTRESWAEMSERPVDYSKLDGGAA